MRMTLNDFARKYGISDRHARRLLADNEADLVGHFERRGGKATLIDEVAAEYLQNILRNPVSVLPEETPAITEREAALLLELANVNGRLAEAERRAGEAAASVALLDVATTRNKELEASIASQGAQIADLSVEIGRERERASQAEERAQAAASELTAAQQRIRELEGRKWWQLLFKKG